MFDDRLEITSPGGMLDGSNIQDLDLTKIPSIRRNTIISDVFNRIHLMERRGSGITRIIESYFDSVKKPVFSSGVSNFTVIFPNKGFKESNKIIPLVEENVVNDSDYFLLKMYKNLAGKVRSNFLENLQKLFAEMGYETEFSREKIEEIFNVKKSRAAEIITILINNNIIEILHEAKYKFKK